MKRNVAVLVETSRAYGRGLLAGIAQYIQTNESWSPLLHSERMLNDGIPSWFSPSNFDGAIIRSDSKVALHSLVATGIPCVDLRCKHDSDAVAIETDDRLVAELAAQHLLDKGFRTISFCGFQGALFSDRRLKFCREYLQKMDVELSVFETLPNRARGMDTSTIESHGTVVEKELIQWLQGLAKPAGVFACNDIRGIQVMQACRLAELEVPEQVAVVGVDNDELVCNLSSPPLSSVANNTSLIGYRAAETLERLMNGSPASEIPKLQLIGPSRVVARRSTDVTVVSDPQISQALRFIRDNAKHDINVSDVVDSVPLSRATLERRFRKVMSRSVNEEIRRTRIERVRKLLAETDLKLSAVAKISGFKSAEYMSTQFKKETGLTPGQYREESRIQFLD